MSFSWVWSVFVFGFFFFLSWNENFVAENPLNAIKAVRIVAFARTEHRISCYKNLKEITDNLPDC